MIKKIINKFFYIIKRIKDWLSLSDKGERVDIDYNKNQSLDSFDIYQKNHLKRYEFVRTMLGGNDIVGDFACGTGYGTQMLSEKSAKVIGVDISEKVIKAVRKRYAKNPRAEFVASNILDLTYKNYFDRIVSFETIEHLDEADIPRVFQVFFDALKNNGKLVFSVPYMQEKSEAAIKMGFHKTFYIDERKIEEWLRQAGFKVNYYKYQNYETHLVVDKLEKKDFIICEASK